MIDLDSEMAPSKSLIVVLFLNFDLVASNVSLEPQIISLVKQLQARIDDVTSDDASPDQDGTNEESRLWRRLGKIQLDAGEYAEAQQIFRCGAKRCPFDKRLVHHLQVWDAFHADSLDQDGKNENNNILEAPEPLEYPLGSDSDSNLFLSLDVPDDAIPEAVLNWPLNNSYDGAKRTRLIHASKEPLLNRKACRFLIKSALETVKKRGWTTDRTTTHTHMQNQRQTDTGVSVLAWHANVAVCGLYSYLVLYYSYGTSLLVHSSQVGRRVKELNHMAYRQRMNEALEMDLSRLDL